MLVMHGGLGQATKPPLAGLGCVWLGKDKGAVQAQQEQARAIQEIRKEERPLKLEGKHDGKNGWREVWVT